MFEYERMASKYGASVTTIGALQKVSIPTNLTERIDVGFDKGGPIVFRRQLGFFRRYPLANDVYAFGDCAKDLSLLMKADDNICSLIYFILSNYAYRLEFSGSILTARVNTYDGFPHNDGTGGERFISTLSAVARGLRGIDENQLRRVADQHSVLGPLRLRRIILTFVVIIGFWLPLIATKIVVHFSDNSGRL